VKEEEKKVNESGRFLWKKKCGFESENEKEKRKRRVKELMKVERVLESQIQHEIEKLLTLFLSSALDE
jgi:hypothetical protein